MLHFRIVRLWFWRWERPCYFHSFERGAASKVCCMSVPAIWDTLCVCNLVREIEQVTQMCVGADGRCWVGTWAFALTCHYFYFRPQNSCSLSHARHWLFTLNLVCVWWERERDRDFHYFHTFLLSFNSVIQSSSSFSFNCENFRFWERFERRKT